MENWIHAGENALYRFYGFAEQLYNDISSGSCCTYHTPYTIILTDRQMGACLVLHLRYAHDLPIQFIQRIVAPSGSYC